MHDLAREAVVQFGEVGQIEDIFVFVGVVTPLVSCTANLLRAFPGRN